MEFEGKVVIVTGSGQGIGREIAAEFAKKKAKVVLCDVNQESLARVEKELSSHTHVLGFRINVTSFIEVENMINKVIANQ